MSRPLKPVWIPFSLSRTIEEFPRRVEFLMTEIPNWQITGDWFDNCSCAVACPCTFAQAPDNGVCELVLFWHIRRGHYGDISLDNLSFVRVGRWEGDLWAGKAKGTAGIFIDERADERQAEVLPRIFGGQVGGFPALVAALFAEGRQVRGVERARITFEIAPDRSRWGTEIAGKVKAWARGPDRPDKPAGQISSTGECARLRDRAGTDRHVGQIDKLFRWCVRLQVSMDDEFEQTYSVRLDWSVIARVNDQVRPYLRASHPRQSLPTIVR